MKKSKKLFAIFLVLVFSATLFPATAFASNTISASKIVSTAKNLVGKYPYIYGGESLKEGGFDCSGLVYYVYHTCLGADMTLSQAGRGKAALAESGTKITNKKNFLPGDIVQFNYPHVAIYIGDNTIVEAAKPGTKVRMRSIKTDNNISYAIRPSYITQGNETVQTNTTTNSSVQAALEAVKKDFPNGSYFTTDGKKNSSGKFLKVATARNVYCKNYSDAETCLAYAKYVWAKVFGIEATVASNRIEIGSGRAGITTTWDKAQPGDLIYFYSDEKLSNWKHAGIFLGKNGDTISLVDCNYANRDPKKEGNKVLYYSVVCGQSGWPYSYVRVYRAVNQNVTKNETYTVTFNPNGGTVSKTSKTVTKGATYGDIPAATRPGYTFVGWCADKSGEGMYISSQTGVLEYNHTVYAIWKKAEYVTISEGTYSLTPKNAAKMRLDISGASTKDGANVQIYTANNTDAQSFEFDSIGNGYYTIKSVVSGKMIDVQNAKTANGTNVWQCAANGSNAQKWMLKDAGGGYYYIVSALKNNLCLDVKGAGTTNGTNVQVYSANQSDAQKWKLTKTEETSEGDNDEPITPPKAKIIVDTTAVLKNGSTGTQVKYLQMNLNAMNYSCGSVDGTYGTNTKNAVLQFQKTEGLTQDGIAGPATLKRMAEIATQTQIDLYKLGYYKGNIDGVLGSGTRTAIKNFQKEYNYYQSSLATLAVRNALTKAVNEK